MSKKINYYALCGNKFVAVSSQDFQDFVPAPNEGKELVLNEERYTQKNATIWNSWDASSSTMDETYTQTETSDLRAFIRLTDKSGTDEDRVGFHKTDLPLKARWINESDLSKIVAVSPDSTHYMNPLSPSRDCVVRVNGVMCQEVVDGSGHLFMPTSQAVSSMTGGTMLRGNMKAVWRGDMVQDLPVIETVSPNAGLQVSTEWETFGMLPYVQDGVVFEEIYGDASITASANTIAVEYDSGEIQNFYFLSAGTTHKVIGLDTAHSLVKVRLSNNDQEVIVGLPMFDNITLLAPDTITFDPDVPQYARINTDHPEGTDLLANTPVILETIYDDTYTDFHTVDGVSYCIPFEYLTLCPVPDNVSDITYFTQPLPKLVITQECNLQSSHTDSTVKIARMAVSETEYDVTGYAYRNNLLLFRIRIDSETIQLVEDSTASQYIDNLPEYGWVSGKGVSPNENVVWDDIPVTEYEDQQVQRFVGQYVTVTREVVDEVYETPRSAYTVEWDVIAVPVSDPENPISLDSCEQIQVTEHHYGYYTCLVQVYGQSVQCTINESFFTNGDVRFEAFPEFTAVPETCWKDENDVPKGCITAQIETHSTVYKAFVEDDNDGETEDAVPDASISLSRGDLVTVLGSCTHGSYVYYKININGHGNAPYYVQAFKISIASMASSEEESRYLSTDHILVYSTPYGTSHDDYSLSIAPGTEVRCYRKYTYSEPVSDQSSIYALIDGDYYYIKDLNLLQKLTLSVDAPTEPVSIVSLCSDHTLQLLSQETEGYAQALDGTVPVLICDYGQQGYSITDSYEDVHGFLKVRKSVTLPECVVWIKVHSGAGPRVWESLELTNVTIYNVMYGGNGSIEYLDVVTCPTSELLKAEVLRQESTENNLYVLAQGIPARREYVGNADLTFSEDLVDDKKFTALSTSKTQVMFRYENLTKGCWAEDGYEVAFPLGSYNISRDPNILLEDVRFDNISMKEGVESSPVFTHFCPSLQKCVAFDPDSEEAITADNLSSHTFAKRLTVYGKTSTTQYFVDQNWKAYCTDAFDFMLLFEIGYTTYSSPEYIWVSRDMYVRQYMSQYNHSVGSDYVVYEGVQASSLKLYSKSGMTFTEISEWTLPSAVFQVLGEFSRQGTDVWYKVSHIWSACQEEIEFPVWVNESELFNNFSVIRTRSALGTEVLTKEDHYILLNTGNVVTIPLCMTTVEDLTDGLTYTMHRDDMESCKTLFKVEGFTGCPFYINRYGQYWWSRYDSVSNSNRLVASPVKKGDVEMLLFPSIYDQQYGVFTAGVFAGSPYDIDVSHLESSLGSGDPLVIPFDEGITLKYQMDWNTDLWNGTYKNVLLPQKSNVYIQTGAGVNSNGHLTVTWYFVKDAPYKTSDSDNPVQTVSGWAYRVWRNSVTPEDSVFVPVEESKDNLVYHDITPVEVVFTRAFNHRFAQLPDLDGLSEPVTVTKRVTSMSDSGEWYSVLYHGSELLINSIDQRYLSYPTTFEFDDTPTNRLGVDLIQSSVTTLGMWFFGYDDDPEYDLKNVIRMNTYYSDKKVSVVWDDNTTYFYHINVAVRDPETGEVSFVPAWCTGYPAVYTEVLVQTFEVSAMTEQDAPVYMYDDVKTMLFDNQDPFEVLCLGHTYDDFIKVRFTYRGEQRTGFVRKMDLDFGTLGNALPECTEGYTVRVKSVGTSVVQCIRQLIDQCGLSLLDEAREVVQYRTLPSGIFGYIHVSYDIAASMYNTLESTKAAYSADAEFDVVDCSGNVVLGSV